MSDLSTNDENAEELPDLRADEDTSSSTRSGTVPSEDSLDPTRTENTSIATLPYDDDTPLDLRTTPVKTRNTLLEASNEHSTSPTLSFPSSTRLDLRTSPARTRNTLLVGIVKSSTTFLNRNDKEQTSARSVISDPRMITHDYQIEPSVCFPTRNDDSGALSILNTSSLQQFPDSTSCNIAGELSHATRIGSSLATSRSSPTVVQAQKTSNMTYRQVPFESRFVKERRLFWENLASRIRPSTSQAVNFMQKSNPNIVWDPRCNIRGSRRQMCEPYSTIANWTPSKCSGNMDPGDVRLDEICDTSTGDTLYDCDSCGCQYTRETNVRRHIRVKHKCNEQPTPMCNVPECTPNFHIGEKPYKCSICEPERRFWHEKDMEWHYRVHSDNKPFKCDICGAGFWRMSLFNGHIPASTL